VLVVNWASLSDSCEAIHAVSNAAFGSLAKCFCSPANSGFFRASTKALVSAALAPWAARDCDSAANTERTRAHPASSNRLMSEPEATASCSAPNSSRASCCDVGPAPPLEAASSTQDFRKSSGAVLKTCSNAELC